MKIHDVKQGSEEWFKLRAGIPTASEFGQLLTPLFKVREGEMPKTFVQKKLAEAWMGGPILGFGGSFMMEQGQVVEQEARPFYELTCGEEVTTVGFCTTDDGTVGCSPDGLIGEDGGIEIKCPEPQTHVKYLLNGVLPDDYAAQVHGALFVTGRPWWRFISYRRGFPLFVITVPREEKIQLQIQMALDDYKDAFDKGWARMLSLNGGPPREKVS